MQVCRDCGWENPEIAAFCTNCGLGLGRGRPTGPRFRALGLSGEFEEVRPGAVDAAWPTSSAKGNPLSRTLVDFPAPDAEEIGGESGPASALVPPPRHAAIVRRTTGPVLLPDEAASSVDIGPMRTEALERVTPSTASDPATLTEDFDPPARGTPSPAVEPAEADEGAVDDVDAVAPEPAERSPDAPAPSVAESVQAAPVEAEAVQVAPVEASAEAAYADEPITEPHPIADPSAQGADEEDGFDEFVDPARPDSIEDVDVPAEHPAEIEIASPDDSLGSAIDDFARDADVRIESPSDSPEVLEEFEDELELSTSDLHTVDLSMDEEPDPTDPLDPGATHPAMRAMPPPLPKVNLHYVLRPFSQRDGHRGLVPIADAPVVIGRSDADIKVMDDDFVSPRHARFAVNEARLTVDDLDSLNGVWLRVRVDAQLDSGDEILIGQQLLRLESVGQRAVGATADGTRRLGMAANGCRFRVAQIANDGAALDVYHLGAQGCRIGRRLGDIVFTDDTFMSGTHALLMPKDGAVVLRDLSSRNGCWVRIRGSRELETGDAVMIGRTVWRVGRPVG